MQGAVICGIEKNLRKSVQTFAPTLENLPTIGEPVQIIKHRRDDVINNLAQETHQGPPGSSEPSDVNSDESVTTGLEGTAIEGTQDVASSTLPTTVSGAPGDGKAEGEDTMSVFTDDQSMGLPETQKIDLVKKVAEMVWQSTITASELKGDEIMRISAALPQLLKELALELSGTASTLIEKQAIAFVRRYRG